MEELKTEIKKFFVASDGYEFSQDEEAEAQAYQAQLNFMQLIESSYGNCDVCHCSIAPGDIWAFIMNNRHEIGSLMHAADQAYNEKGE